METEYIGDGVYVAIERGMLKLMTGPGGRENTIFLEPGVWRNLLRYYDNAKAVEAFPNVDL
jgi:hypothetical protein